LTAGLERGSLCYRRPAIAGQRSQLRVDLDQVFSDNPQDESVDRLNPAVSLSGVAQLAVAPLPARIVPVAEENPDPVISPWLPDSVSKERVRVPPKLSIDPRPAGRPRRVAGNGAVGDRQCPAAFDFSGSPHALEHVPACLVAGRGGPVDRDLLVDDQGAPIWVPA
jgi:hypothetical protein